jgi:hypothetical protein
MYVSGSGSLKFLLPVRPRDGLPSQARKLGASDVCPLAFFLLARRSSLFTCLLLFMFRFGLRLGLRLRLGFRIIHRRCRRRCPWCFRRLLALTGTRGKHTSRKVMGSQTTVTGTCGKHAFRKVGRRTTATGTICGKHTSSVRRSSRGMTMRRAEGAVQCVCMASD